VVENKKKPARDGQTDGQTDAQGA